MTAALLAGIGLTLTANDDREGKQRERRDGDRIERDQPRERDGDREHHEGNELERWARQQQHKAHELLEAGRKEEAQKLMRHVEEVIAKHRKGQDRHAHNKEAEIKEFIEEAERHIHELLKAGKKEEAERVRRHVQEELAALRGERREREHPGHDQRTRHVHQAIEHLKAAGMHEFAKELMAHLHEREHPEREEPRNVRREGDRELEELRNHVRELSHALREIQERLEQRRER